MLRLAIAHLEMSDPELGGEIAGGACEGSVSLRIGGNDASIDTERRRHQGMAEEQALDLRERQNSADFPAALRVQIVRPVPEGSSQHVLPFGQVKEGALGVLVHERIPAHTIARGKRLHRASGHRVRGARRFIQSRVAGRLGHLQETLRQCVG